MDYWFFLIVQMYRADPVSTVLQIALSLVAGFGVGYVVLGPLLG
jgi:hypothetical protein